MEAKNDRTGSSTEDRRDNSAFVEEAERGYDVEKILQRRSGRPTLGEGPSSVESVRLEPELKREIILRASERGISVSEVIREALREYVAAH
ncbi:MAG TPA: CopG family transcriptional regulator [Acidimicrobiales bacterium]|nr:CopG family transcriptional regulator [Acidimicrobiales bacterium]